MSLWNLANTSVLLLDTAPNLYAWDQIYFVMYAYTNSNTESPLQF